MKERAVWYLQRCIESARNAIHYYEELKEKHDDSFGIVDCEKECLRMIGLLEDEVAHFEWILRKIDGADETTT